MSITTPKTITITLDAYTLELLNEYKRRMLKSYNETPCESDYEYGYYLQQAARRHMSEENERPEPEAGEGLRATEAMWRLVSAADAQPTPAAPEDDHAA
ncbi:hypothetical protein F8S13_11935 [Chloroflexia bacterium SDU3-3]|nr:hypothetical protein F8S13_11935 [Chloroflexia bacterium SDU3-3]